MEKIPLEYLKTIENNIWRNKKRDPDKIEGLKIFPDESPLNQIKEDWEQKSLSGQLRLKI